jgi:hypothetical protein
MRLVSALVALGAMGFATAAAAEPVSLTPITFSSDFQTSLERDLGVREGDILRNRIERSVSTALARHGATLQSGAPVTIDIEIIDADPNRPTFHQLSNPPYPSLMESTSIGGAQLRATLRAADGQVLDTVSYRQYNSSFDEFRYQRPTTWSEAGRAINVFADKVADAYLAHAR